MQCAMLPIEFALERLDAGGHLLTLLPPARRAIGALVKLRELFPYRADNRLTILVDVMDHDDPLTETSGIESLVDDLERRLLLTDHKQAAAGADRIGDHVDDRLALAGTRRPFHQQPATIARLQHRRFL